jgi:hypothetical protein
MDTNQHEWEQFIRFIRAFIREFREFTQIKNVPNFKSGSEILPITINH